MQGLFKRASVSLFALMLILPAAADAQTAKTVPESQMQMQLSFAPLVKQTSGAVVNVYAEKIVQRQSPFAGDPFFEQFFGQQMPNRSEKQSSLGSGVIVEANGTVVTNNHVVEGANELAVALPDGTLRPTQLVGVDPDSDLALLKIEGNGLKPIAVGDIKGLAVGDVVLAVGNPLGVGQTVTQGIVSALGRKGIGINPIENFIQTDAAINPGNSGGALIDTQGRLIGINSAILSRGGGSEGIGFAIPIDLAQKVIASLKKQGRVARGWLGVSTGPVGRGQSGALVMAVQPRGPADRAGIAPGDIIVKFGDHVIEQPEDLAGVTLELEPGATVTAELLRDGRRGNANVVLGTRPPLRRQ
jgi:Do/DeqQ family serine protease